MAASDIGSLPNFDCQGDATSVGPRWKRWKRAFTYYVQGRNIDNAARKRALLLHSAGMEVQDLFETLDEVEFHAEGEGDVDDVYKQALRMLDAYFIPKVNVPYERHVFRSLKQKEDETVDQFVTRLKKQSLNCDFGDDQNDQIRDQVIDMCKSSQLRRKLLQRGADLTLEVLLDTARAMEAVDHQSKSMEASSGNVNRLWTKDAPRANSYCGNARRGAARGNSTYRPDNKFRKTCYRCGREGHISSSENCPARDAQCNDCGGLGHFSIKCRTKSRDEKKPGGSDKGHKFGYRGDKKKKFPRSHSNYVEADQESDVSDEYAFHLRDDDVTDNAVIDVKVGGVYLRTLIDSGSTANVIDSKTWKYLKAQKVKCVSERTVKRLYPYGTNSEPLDIMGTFSATVEVEDRQVEAKFLVIRGEGRALLSKTTAEQLGVLKVGLNVNAVHSEKLTLEDIKQRYPDVCDGIGKLKDYQAKIHLDLDVKPVAQNQRRIPFAMREKLETKIQELLRDDIIEPVEGPTPWVSPIVIIPKPGGDVRICVDMRQANSAVIRERHPIPTVDEVIHRMNESTVFSKIDLKCGFHQIELTEDSRVITTFACHTGLFRYKRLMFGITSAPELFQHVIQQVIADCEGVENISDDLIVHGNSDDEHDKRLVKVIETLIKNGLTINVDKCLIRLPELEYMGHIMSGNGISPTQDRVKAVMEARKPNSASEVRSFLGLVNFSARFIPNLATIAEPLRKLTRQGEPFRWGQSQETAFQRLIDELSKAETLAYFKKDAETEIVVDASPVGLGAILVQHQYGEKRVICYASRSLTAVERRYSQTEKEALGIVWACERFHAYLFGIHFQIVTDHKPLIYIYSPRSKPSARIERWVLRLQPYDFEVKHIPGKEMVADALSRLVERTDSQEVEDDHEYVRFIAEMATPKALKTRDIERESEKDENLEKIRHCLKSGNWDDCPTEYKGVRNELCSVGMLVLRGTRIIIPEKLREQVVSLAHEGHAGIVKTKQRLRSKVWWPGIDRDAEKECRTCHGCQLVAQPSNPEPIKRFEMPTLPWQDTATDLLGPMPGGEYILAIVDYYSRYVEVAVMKSITTAKVIQCLNQIFATHGYPLTLKTDNGPQFISEEFENYLEENGIEHRLSPPLWPQANGEIERQNRTLLKSMRIAHAQGKDWTGELYKALLSYRTTPHETTGVTPSKMMFGREIRSKLPEFREDNIQRELCARDRDAEHKQKGKDYADQRRNAKESNLQVGDRVLMQQPKHNKLSTRYEEKPLIIVEKTGSKITVENDRGKQYARNAAHLRKFEEKTTSESDASTKESRESDPEIGSSEIDESKPLQQGFTKSPSKMMTTRSGRTINTPVKFKDYVKI